VLKKLDYPLAPLVLALVLGDRTEEAFRQSLLISEGDMRSSSTTGCRARSWRRASRWRCGR
jgi:TctA family transporter